MKFGIITSKGNKKAQELSSKIKKYLLEKGHFVSDSDLTNSDLLITLGGDGTMIHAASEYAHLNTPFFGINVGTLGFLTAVEANEWQEAIDKIIDGKFFVSERMTLEAEMVPGNKYLVPGKNKPETRNQGLSTRFRALNEIVVKGMYRVIDLELLVDDQKFISIQGDGVIVSTETGSTAYSLSAGGPIVDPEIDCFLVTPINAVGLPIPSVALSPDDVIEIKINSGNDISLVIDGQKHVVVSRGQSIKVSKGEHKVKLVYLDKHHFLRALNAKFGLASRLVG